MSGKDLFIHVFILSICFRINWSSNWLNADLSFSHDVFVITLRSWIRIGLMRATIIWRIFAKHEHFNFYYFHSYIRMINCMHADRINPVWIESFIWILSLRMLPWWTEHRHQTFVDYFGRKLLSESLLCFIFINTQNDKSRTGI